MTKRQVLYFPPGKPNAESQAIADGWAAMQLMSNDRVGANVDWKADPAYQVNLLLKSKSDMCRDEPAMEADPALIGQVQAALFENLQKATGKVGEHGFQGKHVLQPWCETNIVKQGVNKGQSLNRFINSPSVKGVLREVDVGKNVMVAGDAQNDLPMFLGWGQVDEFRGLKLEVTAKPAIRVIMPDADDEKLLAESNVKNKCHEVLEAVLNSRGETDDLSPRKDTGLASDFPATETSPVFQWMFADHLTDTLAKHNPLRWSDKFPWEELIADIQSKNKRFRNVRIREYKGGVRTQYTVSTMQGLLQHRPEGAVVPSSLTNEVCMQKDARLSVEDAAIKVQSVHRGNLSRQESAKRKAKDARLSVEDAAIKIQSVHRGNLARQESAKQQDKVAAQRNVAFEANTARSPRRVKQMPDTPSELEPTISAPLMSSARSTSTGAKRRAKTDNALGHGGSVSSRSRPIAC
jgi:hypothetical protein